MGLYVFDTALPETLLTTARATHPQLVTPAGRAVNPDFVDPAAYLSGLPVPFWGVLRWLDGP